MFCSLLFCSLLFSCQKKETLFASDTSPTGKYSVLIYAYEPECVKGVVKLVDNQTNEILREKKMSYVRYDFSVVSWRDREVGLDLFATWKLPRGNGGEGVQMIQYQ